MAKKFTDRYPVEVVAPLCDAALIVMLGWLVYFLRFDTFDLHERYVLAISVISLLVIVFNVFSGGYSRWRVTRLPSMLLLLFFSWILVSAVSASMIFIFDASDRYSRLWLFGTLSLSFSFAAGARVGIHFLLKKMRLKGKGRIPVFLVGPQDQLIKVARGMRVASGEGYSIAGIERFDLSLDYYDYEKLANRVAASKAREVWICFPLESGGAVRLVFHALRNNMADVRFVPDFEGMLLINHRFSEVVGRMSIDLSVSPMNGIARVAKRVEDVVIGSIAIVFVAPVCLVICALVFLDSPGPVLFKQYRTGSNGKKFKVYKFRTMKVHQEGSGAISQAKRNDPRVTKVGAFLRKSSLDELPQFFNVLQGRMSIVGPRPHALSHNEYYKECVESYMRRHKVKPGITGWAQVNGFRGETDTLLKMQRRVDYDLWYIDNWSLYLDVKIIFMTVWKGFFGENAY